MRCFLARPTVIVLILAFAAVGSALGHSTYTGRTLKTSTSGCSCHGSANSSVTARITGPDTVVAGQVADFYLAISGNSGTRVACDVAVSAGALATADANMALSGGELLTNGTKTYASGGSYVYHFKWTLPAAAGTATLYANGLANTSAWNFAPNKTVTVVSATAVATVPHPSAFALLGAYPNPFNPSAVISYTLSEAAGVTLTIYDARGKEVERLMEGAHAAGAHTAVWNAARFASGVYFCRLTAVTFSGATLTRTTKLVLAK